MNIYSYINYKWIKHNKNQEIANTKKYNYFILLIPVLREQNVVSEIMKNLSSLKYPKKFYKIIFITTEREQYEYKRVLNNCKDGISREDSYNKIKNILRKNFSDDMAKNIANKIFNIKNKAERLNFIEDYFNNILSTYKIIKKENNLTSICHYPFVNGNKASQLNYFMDKIKEYIPNKYLNDKMTYIGIYDADSNPDKSTLLFINKMLENQQYKVPAIIQQPSLCLNNLNSIKKNLSGLFIKCDILFQLKWNLGFELTRLRKENKFKT
ncbi:MAG: hypothetical protein ABF289_16000 [Clostridiales bacterium]